MRFALITAALFAAGCDASVTADAPAGSAEGYTLEVRATESEQMFVVTAPDGVRAGGRASGAESALMNAESLQALAAMPGPTPPTADGDAQVAFRMPGINIAVSGEDGGEGHESGRVAIDIGGRRINVDAADGGPEGERAHVLISGASAEDARDFIQKADELSPQTQADMLAALGLN